jgi:hypothetical protein
MSSLRENKDRKFLRFSSDVLQFFACLLLLLSVFQPITTITYYLVSNGHEIPVFTQFKVSYWSYKAIVSIGQVPYLFNDYWFNNNKGTLIMPSGFSTFFITIFFSQIATIALGLISLKVRKIRVVSLVTSLIVPVSIIRLFLRIDVDIGRLFGFVEHGLGYWLTWPSVFLFLLASVLYFVSRKNSPQT